MENTAKITIKSLFSPISLRCLSAQLVKGNNSITEIKLPITSRKISCEATNRSDEECDRETAVLLPLSPDRCRYVFEVDVNDDEGATIVIVETVNDKARAWFKLLRDTKIQNHRAPNTYEISFVVNRDHKLKPDPVQKIMGIYGTDDEGRSVYAKDVTYEVWY